MNVVPNEVQGATRVRRASSEECYIKYMCLEHLASGHEVVDSCVIGNHLGVRSYITLRVLYKLEKSKILRLADANKSKTVLFARGMRFDAGWASVRSSYLSLSSRAVEGLVEMFPNVAEEIRADRSDLFPTPRSTVSVHKDAEPVVKPVFEVDKLLAELDSLETSRSLPASEMAHATRDVRIKLLRSVLPVRFFNEAPMLADMPAEFRGFFSMNDDHLRGYVIGNSRVRAFYSGPQVVLDLLDYIIKNPGSRSVLVRCFVGADHGTEPTAQTVAPRNGGEASV